MLIVALLALLVVLLVVRHINKPKQYTSWTQYVLGYKTVCALCKQIIRGGYTSGEVSHGICKYCDQRVTQEFNHPNRRADDSTRDAWSGHHDVDKHWRDRRDEHFCFIDDSEGHEKPCIHTGKEK